MAKFRRALIEIGNVCNLRCAFCADSKRPPVLMSVENFEKAAKQVNEFAKVISLHLLGEPMLHPHFPEILSVSSKLNLKINLVSNGSLIYRYPAEVWSEKCLKQVTISAQSLSCYSYAERFIKLDEYINFAKTYSDKFKVSFRLRGPIGGGFITEISDYLIKAFNKTGAWDGSPYSLSERVFMNHGDIFKWRNNELRNVHCLGLKHHFGVLSDGTVVPCCADYDGFMKLGNIFEKPLVEILNSKKTKKMREAIEGKNGELPEYCKHCGFEMPS